MLMLLCSLLVCNPPTRQEQLLSTWKAICWVESRGDPLAYNKAEQAAGIAQIRPVMIADVNRIMGWPKFALRDRWDAKRSWDVFRCYSLYYSPSGGPQEWSRKWNGGPAGMKKASTRAYWLKVRAEMARH